MKAKTTEMLELRGVEVQSFYSLGTPVLCFVAHADREVGITIKCMDTGEDAFCINKETVITGCARQGNKANANRLWHELFSNILATIEAGEGPLAWEINYATGVIRLDTGRSVAMNFSCAWE